MQKGFSLIELLIVLAIISIIAVIAYPTYTTHVMKANRAQAKVALVDLANRLEHYYIIHHTYQHATVAELNPSTLSFYRLEIQQTSENAFLLRAIPIETQSKDQECGAFTLNQNGEKGITGSGDAKECWG